MNLCSCGFESISWIYNFIFYIPLTECHQCFILGTLDVVPVARLEDFRDLKFSRLESFMALKFQNLPDMAHEPCESKYIIGIPKNLFKLFSFFK